MSEYIIFGGIDSRNFGVHIFDSETDNSPERTYTRHKVEGRSGDLFIDQNRFENVEHSYWGIIYENYEENLRNFRSAMKSKIGYQKLEDSFHSDEYYDAVFIEALEVETAIGRNMGKFEIIFDRKPQRWLNSGDTAITLTSSGTITNPTLFQSNPLLRIYGTGTIYIGDQAITVSEADGYTDVDCFTMEAYKGTVSKNSVVSFNTLGKVSLKSGANNVQVPNTVTRLEVIPRWYRV